ncbi:hypothetical protein [Evansella halocellulosilytica]|uniref:hypothetical protein n=1 Tax=Evansella halocellulosilytica TaxID=2011013 RepID=UPI000BB82FB5|nr:hypothetical protein [Evansella halocellulosilytica]
MIQIIIINVLILVAILFVVRKVAMIPSKKIGVKTIYKVFAAYIGLLLLAVPISYVLSANEEMPEIVSMEDKVLEEDEAEKGALIQAGEVETILSDYRAQREVFQLNGDTLTWTSALSEYTTFDLYVEETSELTSEFEVVHIYPKLIITNMDLTQYYPNVDLIMDDDLLTIRTENDIEVHMKMFDYEFIINQFRDSEIYSWGLSGGSSEGPHTLWIRVPEGTVLNSVETETPFHFQYK